MAILARRPRSVRAARFRTPPWHPTHPAQLDLEQRLGPDHLARRVDAAIERLDLDPLRALYHGTGSAAHPPERLLRVVLYEMRRGHHSPAEWHRDARECEPVRWLLRGAAVARSCWYAFRDRVAPLLPALHQQVLALAQDAGLTTATRAAADGTLVAALASRHKLLNQEALQRRADQLAAATAGDAPAAATGPAAAAPPPAEPAEPASRPAWLAGTAAGRRQQQRRLERARRRLEELQARERHKRASKRKAAGAVVVNPSEPEAVVARDKEKVYRPLYNVQFLDDLDSPLILGYGAFAQQNDTGLLPEMLAQARQQVGHGLRVLLADGSYAGGADLAAADRAGVTVYAPVPGDGVKNPKQIPKRDFAWQAAGQAYVCPQGHRLELEESWREKRADGGVQVWRYRCDPLHCQGCPLQPRCTRTPAKGRAVTRLEHEELIEALRARMAGEEAQALYRLRKQTVELVNADVKQHRKLRRFSGRGLARARCEVGLVVLAHNLLTLAGADQKAQAQQAPAVAVNSDPDGP
jgi:transposase